jgi:hypothetical protein
MNDLKQSYQQLKDLLQNVMKQLQSPGPWQELQQKEQQLQAIERALQKMQKSDIAIPVEMREAKLRLIKELENDNEIYRIQAGLVDLLVSALEDLGYDMPKEEVIKKKRKKRAYEKGKRISLNDLCREGLLSDGVVLYHHGKDGHYEAVIKSGKMILKKGHSNLEFDNPSAAAVEVSGANRNGWTFWLLNFHNKIVYLDTVRKAYKKKKDETI